MKKDLFVITILCVILCPYNTFAHPGRTDSNGCHYCRTNCASWGLNQDEYHCHSGNTYTNSLGQVFNADGSMVNSSSKVESNNQSTTNTPTIKKTVAKSSDNSIKSIIVDNNQIDVNDIMTYQTSKSTVDIKVELNDSKATYKIDKSTLVIGDNTVNITVTAENGNSKNYVLNVTRKDLSKNTNVKIYVDNKEITFENDTAEINVPTSMINLNYKYELEDVNANLFVNGDKNLKDGKNSVIFEVTAEDGTKKVYTLIVNKTDEDTNPSILDNIVTIGIVGGLGYGSYRLIKKKK
mgnify:FL=1